MPFPYHIFKAYDIRGKYPVELDEAMAERIGNATAVYLSKRRKKKVITIVVCRDVRSSSQKLHNALLRGLIMAGANVFDTGMGTTPFIYFLVHSVKCDGGIIVTASHNPSEYNGFKIRGYKGSPVAEGCGMEEIKALVEHNVLVREKKQGTIKLLEGFEKKYIAFLTKRAAIRPIKAVIDAGGGATCFFLPDLLRHFPKLSYTPLFFEPDGTFTKHSPNPLEAKAQVFVKKEIEKGGYRFGAVFDGDGDRIIFFDEKGTAVPSEFIGALFLEEALKKNPKSVVVTPANASRGMRECVEAKGGKVKISRVGYPFIQPMMRKTKAVLGVELSGHFHFKDFNYKDSGLLALVRLARLLSQTARPLSQLVLPYQKYISSGERNFSVQNKHVVMESIRVAYEHLSGAKISCVDGISVDFPDWWFNVRASNTEPLVRLVLEAKTSSLFHEKLKEIESFLK